MSYFRVLLDGVDIYNPQRRDMLLINPVAKPSLDEAGGFDFTMDASHAFYNSIVPFGSDIEVLEDGRTIFFGRPLPPTISMYRQKTYHCEGVVAWLNDIIVPPLEKYVPEFVPEVDEDDPGFSSGDEEEGQSEEEKKGLKRRVIYMSEYIDYVIQTYNRFQTNSKRRLVLGTVDLEADPGMPYDSDFKTCLDILRSEILPNCGGYLVATKSGGTVYLNILRSFGGANQPIKAGVNLLDFAEAQQGFYTAVIAKGGKSYDDWEDEEEQVVLTEPVYMTGDIISRYGVICAYRYWPAITSEEDLRYKCEEFLNSQQFNKMSIEVSAMDLHISNRAYDCLTVGTTVRFESPIPGDGSIDMIVSNMEVFLDTGEKKIQLGDGKSKLAFDSGIERSKMTQRWNKAKEEKNTEDILVEDAVIEDNDNPVSSGGVYDAIEDAKADIAAGVAGQHLTVGAIFQQWIGTLEEYKELLTNDQVRADTVYYVIDSSAISMGTDHGDADG